MIFLRGDRWRYRFDGIKFTRLKKGFSSTTFRRRLSRVCRIRSRAFVVSTPYIIHQRDTAIEYGEGHDRGALPEEVFNDPY